MGIIHRPFFPQITQSLIIPARVSQNENHRSFLFACVFFFQHSTAANLSRLAFTGPLPAYTIVKYILGQNSKPKL